MLISDTENIPSDLSSGLFSLFEVEKLHIKDESRVGRNGAGNSLGAVAHVRADGQLGSLALRHLGHTVVPASDDLRGQNHYYSTSLL